MQMGNKQFFKVCLEFRYWETNFVEFPVTDEYIKFYFTEINFLSPKSTIPFFISLSLSLNFSPISQQTSVRKTRRNHF